MAVSPYHRKLGLACVENYGEPVRTARSGARRALKFVLVLGVVSFFADFTYEGSRSVTGPFLERLGASGAIVGAIAGLGELLGYSEPVPSGRSRYWGTSSRWRQCRHWPSPGIGRSRDS